jgi:hypothetical protein
VKAREGDREREGSWLEGIKRRFVYDDTMATLEPNYQGMTQPCVVSCQVIGVRAGPGCLITIARYPQTTSLR